MKFHNQRTLARSISFESVGLHTGKMISMRLCSAPADTGIVFKRVDVKENESLVAASFKNVVKTTLGTVVANKAGVEVSTIEHLMAALWGCGVDNAIVEINGPEVPIMDGSSEPFIRLIEAAGTVKQEAVRQILVIKDEIKVGDDSRGAVLRPYRGFKIKFDIAFKDSAISDQKAKFEFKASTFKDEIARARTFGFKEEVEAMHKAGLGRGGSLENAIVVDNGKILNPEGLRFDDEFVRHKVLDAVGDLFTAGAHIQGEFIGKKSGHHTNNELLRALMDNPFAWEMMPEKKIVIPVNQMVTQPANGMGYVTAQ